MRSGRYNWSRKREKLSPLREESKGEQNCYSWQLTWKGKQNERNGPETLGYSYRHGLRQGPIGMRQAYDVILMSMIKMP